MTPATSDVLPVTVLPLGSGDRTTVLQVFQGLGERSRRLRFHGSKPRLSETELGYLADVGDRGREAVVAHDGDGTAIGIARYVADAEDSSTAEVASPSSTPGRGRGSVDVSSLRSASMRAAAGSGGFVRRSSSGTSPPRP